MKNKTGNDIASKGLAAGLFIPVVLMFIILLILSTQYESVSYTFNYYQNLGVLYKFLSLCLMPGAGLFFYWSKKGKMNQARGAMLATLAYGVVVVYMYFT